MVLLSDGIVYVAMLNLPNISLQIHWHQLRSDGTDYDQARFLNPEHGIHFSPS